MKLKGKKPTSIDDLAIMVAKGFENTATKSDLAGLRQEMDARFKQVDERLEKVEHKVEALNSNVVNYLELSEKKVCGIKTARCFAC